MNKKELEEHRRLLLELCKDYKQKIDKAIKYIKEMKKLDYFKDNKNLLILLEILGDKDIEEIPLFKGTLEQLNNLSILGDKENE